MMLFNSFDYVLFFPIVTILYFVLPKRIKPIWLLCSSYFFYMCWNVYYLSLILFTTVVTFLSGILLEKVSKKKLVLIGCIGANLLILFVFKYFDFFLDNLNSVLNIFGHGSIRNPFNFLLPVGISFYTFQAIGYVIDVYRGDVTAEKNIINYALFVSFFPQLVAGPIERSKNLLSQIREIRTKRLYDYDSAVSGFILILWGLFTKMVIADRAAVLVDYVFSQYYLYGTFELLLAAVLFAVQIYADFYGYSSIAIGSARVMGIKLMDNFNTPYLSVSISDFWSRWHISLSTWFKDYVYIPLGGNRKGRVRKYINLFITFIISGLWHGASWNYVAWGFIHGFYRVVGEITKPVKDKLYKMLNVKTDVFSFNFLKRIVTFLLVVFAWIFFRAKTLSDALKYIKRLFTHTNPWVLFGENLYELGLDRREFGILILAILFLFVFSILKSKSNIDPGYYVLKQNLWFRWAFMILLIVIILIYGEYGINFDSAKFIYFDF